MPHALVSPFRIYDNIYCIFIINVMDTIEKYKLFSGGGVQDGGTHVPPWLIHVNVWQKPPQYCKVISL